MATRISATELARTLSDVLNRVAGGEEIEVIRNGAPVASIAPPRPQFIPIERLIAILEDAPSPDADFAADLDAIRRESGPLAEDPWPS